MKQMDEKQTDLAAAALSLDNQLCFAAYSLSHAFNRIYRPLLDKIGLTYPQYLAMLVLWEKDDQLVGDIARKLLLESSTVTPLLRRLEAIGLIRRARRKEDERQVSVRLTEKGRAMRERALEVPQCVFEATGMDIPALVQLREAIAAVRSNLLESGRTAPEAH